MQLIVFILSVGLPPSDLSLVLKMTLKSPSDIKFASSFISSWSIAITSFLKLLIVQPRHLKHKIDDNKRAALNFNI